MTRPEQTQNELAAVRHLAQHVPELADADIRAASADPPDVIVSDIGIEVTEFHRKRGTRPLIAIEKECERVTQMAWKAYRQRGGRSQHVKVRFHRRPLPRGQSDEIAEGLAHTVLDHSERPSPSLKIRGEDLPEPLSSYVQWINSDRPGDGWDCIGGPSVENSWDEVVEMVRAKEAGMSSWRADVKRRWLLVVAPATEDVDGSETLLSSSVFPHAEVLPEPTFRSQFERVYFLDVLTETVRRLA